MKIQRLILLALCNLFLLSNISLLAQFRVMIGQDTISDKLYSIQSDHYKSFSGYYFPECFDNDSALYDGVRPMKFQKIKGLSDKKQFAWSKEFITPIPINIDTTFVYQRFFTKNIKSYSIYYLINENNRWYKKEYDIEFEKYQLPHEECLSKWKPLNDTVQFNMSFNKKDSLKNIGKRQHIKQIVIIAEPIKASTKIDFVIGEFSIYNKFVKKIEFTHPFFDQLVKRNSIGNYNANSLTITRNYPTIITPFSYYCFDENLNGQFKVELEDDSDEIDAVKQVFYHIFNKYPFYSERGISKDDILNQFDLRTSGDSLEINEISKEISRIVKKFHDPHFYVPKSKSSAKRNKRKKISPLRVYQFYNDLYIAAVFDSTLLNKIQSGMKVVSLNGTPINGIVNKTNKSFTGTKTVRRHKAVASLMNGFHKDSIEITLLNAANDTIHTIIPYNEDNIQIPNNFKAKHGNFKIVNDEIAYLRFNNFNRGDWIRFVNLSDELIKMKGLIIDLRNNGGGHESEAFRIASCFINNPAVYSHAEYSLSEKEKIKETLMIHPNEHLDLSHLEVIILGNARTACACEMFIKFMQTNHNALFVGNNRTAGAYASVFEISFPSGFSCQINGLAKLLSPDNEIIETKGIEPDIYIQLNKVNDLAPYDDKMLQTAISILNSSFSTNMKKSHRSFNY